MDQLAGTSSTICHVCGKGFSNKSNLKRHLDKLHNEIQQTDARENVKCFIVCPLCEVQNNFRKYTDLIKHLMEIHGVHVEELTYKFCSIEQYKKWKDTERIPVLYVKQRSGKNKGFNELYYYCNRTITAYESQCRLRTPKSGGSIKMHKTCPSRLIVKFYEKGEVSVTYWKTHVGHQENELRCQRLTKKETNLIVEKLKCGVSADRIINDARKINGSNLERINILKRTEILYLSKKYKVQKKTAGVLGTQSEIERTKKEEIDNFIEKVHSGEEIRTATTEEVDNERLQHILGNIQTMKPVPVEYIDKLEALMKEIERAKGINTNVTRKRNLDTQEYFESKKMRES